MIFTATLPHVKDFLRAAPLPATSVGLLVRLITAFCADLCDDGRDAAKGS